MTKGLESTLNLLNLRPSDLKKAQEVVPGGNRPDLLVGGEPAPAGAPVPTIEPEAAAAQERPGPERKTSPPAAGLAQSRTARESTAVAPGVSAPRGGPSRNRQANAGKPKFASLTRIDVRFRDDQIDFLTDFEIKLRRRDVREERLTKASIIRTVVDILPHIDLDLNAVSDEESLRARIFNNLGIPRNKPSQPSPKASKIA